MWSADDSEESGVHSPQTFQDISGSPSVPGHPEMEMDRQCGVALHPETPRHHLALSVSNFTHTGERSAVGQTGHQCWGSRDWPNHSPQGCQNLVRKTSIERAEMAEARTGNLWASWLRTRWHTQRRMNPGNAES